MLVNPNNPMQQPITVFQSLPNHSTFAFISIPAGTEGNMIGLAELATAVAMALAPYAPAILEGGKKLTIEAAKKFAGKAGEAAWEKAVALWGQLQPTVSGNPKLEGAMIALSGNPKDEVSLKLFSKGLMEYLEKNATLREELAKLLGGQDAVQEIVARGGSSVRNIIQDISGGGQQRISADNSIVENVIQRSNSNRTS
jgi:hypothetical protein